jgi:hypothetical protein
MALSAVDAILFPWSGLSIFILEFNFVTLWEQNKRIPI